MEGTPIWSEEAFPRLNMSIVTWETLKRQIPLSIY